MSGSKNVHIVSTTTRLISTSRAMTMGLFLETVMVALLMLLRHALPIAQAKARPARNNSENLRSNPIEWFASVIEAKLCGR